MTDSSMIETEAAAPPGTRLQPPSPTSLRSAGSPYWALIDRSDDSLLDFDAAALQLDLDQARGRLAQDPAIYRNHLTIAKFIEGWITRITDDAKPSAFNAGFLEALMEMMDHLREGDFADDPGGPATDPGRATV